MLSEAEPVDLEETFFWEKPEARAILAANSDLVNMEEYGSDSEQEETRVVVKKLSELRASSSIADSTAAKWAMSELYTQRIRKRDWRVRTDRMDGTGLGDHRSVTQKSL